MKHLCTKILLAMLISMMGINAFAHDIEVENADGVTIYYNYINDGKELEVTFRGSYYNQYYNEYQGNIIIPEEVTYMNRTRKVTSIGKRAFYNCSGLTSVSIPNSVTSIGNSAFFQCFSLTSVTIGNSVMSIGDYAFQYCGGLTSVTIPNFVTSIGDYAFQYCRGLTSVTIGNSVTSIGYGAFEGCSGLTSVTIPNSVTSIGYVAFSNCSGLTSVTIPNSVTSIGEGVFSNCSGLTSVTIPNSVTSIGSNAFNGCSGLTSVTIPNSVTSIGYGAFEGCSGLTSVISLIEEPFRIYGKSSGSGTFDIDVFYNVTLYVPVGTIDKYKSTEGWKDFLFIEEGTLPSGLANVRANPVLIQNNGNVLSISGAPEGAEINVYSLSGQKAGSAKAASESTDVITTLNAGEIGIVKIGEKAVKVAIK